MTPGDISSWNSYVLSADMGTFFHLAEWKEIFSQEFGFKPYFLLAEQDGNIVGVLPMVHQQSLLFGNSLVSSPFLVEGGPLANDADVRKALDDAALDLMRQSGAKYVEFRSRTASRKDWACRKDLYATFKRAIGPLDEKNLLAIPRKQRAVVRKTLSSSLTSTIDATEDRFFQVYAESVRNLGTPVFSKRYFALLLEKFSGYCDIVVILDNGQAVSAVLSFYFKDAVLPYYGGGTAQARRNGANDFLYWELMRRAAARGYTQFDFGRSKSGTGAFNFKRNWGFEPEWLEYEYFLSRGQTLPEKNPNNPRYRLAIQAWKRLPLPVANFLGPFLISGLG